MMFLTPQQQVDRRPSVTTASSGIIASLPCSTICDRHNAMRQRLCVSTSLDRFALQLTCAVGCAGSEQAVDKAADVNQSPGRPAAHALRQSPPASCGRSCRWSGAASAMFTMLLLAN